LLFGTLAASAAGRVFYQTALTATKNDNGYVTMFFLLTPVLTPLVCLPLSRLIPSLQFLAGPLFFIGTALVTVPLLLFSLITWRGEQVSRASEQLLPEIPGRHFVCVSEAEMHLDNGPARVREFPP
jgi:hypothetical protein